MTKRDYGPITLDEWAKIVREAEEQPPWRTNADREADYADGNQLSTRLMQAQAEFGIPPAKENIITPVIAAVCGYEAKTRTDWRVTPDGDPNGHDLADALNYRLNQAERHSKADKALSDAFRPAVAVGIGWVEVARSPSLLEYPYRCRAIHRNEIWWDMKATEADLSDARWLMRRRWINKHRAATTFPEHVNEIMHGPSYWLHSPGELLDGGTSTGLMQAADAERAWTQTEDNWYNRENDQVLISELWYRRWEPTTLLVTGDRVVRFDEENEVHLALAMTGHGKLVEEIAPTMRRAYWMGPHLLDDSPTPYPHHDFPYVMVPGYREDMTGIHYGIVRDMMFPQDNINSSIAKLRWGMSVVRTERTKGAVAMSDDQYRRQIARGDADIILNAEHMAKPGARYEVKRDFELNDQQFQLMRDSRAAIERVSGVSLAFMGQSGTAQSGIQEQTQLEQSQVTLGLLMDRFAEARKQVGELLLSLIIEDIGKEPETIIIEGNTIKPTRVVNLNTVEFDEQTGLTYLSNDVQRARLLVALEDVPSSGSFRAQQLQVLGDAVESLPPEMQQVAMPFLIDLMDLPYKSEVVEALQGAMQQPDPEQMREQIKQELMGEFRERELAIKEREIAIKESKAESEIANLDAKSVQLGVQAAYAAMQAAGQIAQIPQIAPIADEVMVNAGYRRPDPMGDDPNYPVPGEAAARNMRAPYVEGQGAQVGSEQLLEARQNTSPEFPPVPRQGMDGVETPGMGDNI